MGYNIAVLGATGLVGRALLDILEERDFPVSTLLPLASRRSAGTTVRFAGNDVEVREATPDAFEGVDIVLSSAGGSVSQELLPEAVARGAVAIDNTSAFRMDPDVPLVVPEVNPHRIGDVVQRGIIANPNCSTIQLVVALKPLQDAFGLRRVVVSTYQSVSGAGQGAVDTLKRDLADPQHQVSPAPPPSVAFNAVPHIDVFREDGSTKEEWKMRVETPKILETAVEVHATCVRVPVLAGHSESVWIETERPARPSEVRDLLRTADGVRVLDDSGRAAYPTCCEAAGSDAVWIGRIRKDPTVSNGIAMWIVADNIRKGAALNAVQIAEKLIELWEVEGRPTR